MEKHMTKKTKGPDWQDAMSKVCGGTPCSTVDKQRAFQLLHDSGMGYRLGGHISETLRHMVERGVVRTKYRP